MGVRIESRLTLRARSFRDVTWLRVDLGKKKSQKNLANGKQGVTTDYGSETREEYTVCQWATKDDLSGRAINSIQG